MFLGHRQSDVIVNWYAPVPTENLFTFKSLMKCGNQKGTRLGANALEGLLRFNYVDTIEDSRIDSFVEEWFVLSNQTIESTHAFAVVF